MEDRRASRACSGARGRRPRRGRTTPRIRGTATRKVPSGLSTRLISVTASSSSSMCSRMSNATTRLSEASARRYRRRPAPWQPALMGDLRTLLAVLHGDRCPAEVRRTRVLPPPAARCRAPARGRLPGGLAQQGRRSRYHQWVSSSAAASEPRCPPRSVIMPARSSHESVSAGGSGRPLDDPLGRRQLRKGHRRRGRAAWVEMPISAPNPNSPPSVNRLDALTMTTAASTSDVNRRQPRGPRSR